MPHRTPIIALAVLAASSAANAVEYSPPDGTGWWQLQSTDGTYTEVCAEGTGPCDVEPGTYTLIDFGTSPATRTSVRVRGDDGSDMPAPGGPRYTIVTNTDPRPTLQAFGSEFYVIVSCPAGQVGVSGDCSGLAENDPESSAVHGIWGSTGSRRTRCDWPRNSGPLIDVTINTACVDRSLFSQ